MGNKSSTKVPATAPCVPRKLFPKRFTVNYKQERAERFEQVPKIVANQFLPNELFLQVLQYLPLMDIVKYTSRVNRQFFAHCMHEATWKFLLQTRIVKHEQFDMELFLPFDSYYQFFVWNAVYVLPNKFSMRFLGNNMSIGSSALISICVMGETSKIGNTALWKSMEAEMDLQLFDFAAYKSVETIGAEFAQFPLFLNDQPYKVQFWDAKYHDTLQTIMSKVSVTIVTVDMSQADGLQQAKVVIEHIQRLRPLALIILAGTKADLPCLLNMNELLTYVHEKDIPFFPTSAKSGIGVQKLIAIATLAAAGYFIHQNELGLAGAFYIAKQDSLLHEPETRIVKVIPEINR